jgi:hypothetical protein
MKVLYIKLTLFIACTIAFCSLAFSQPAYLNITNYQVYYGWIKQNGQELIVIRKFENNGNPLMLLVNPQTLETKVEAEGNYTITPASLIQLRGHFKNTAYQKALQQAEKQSVKLQDAGITSGGPAQNGITLTADLCPSHRALDRRIFTAIAEAFKKTASPAPIALSVTGVWIHQHQQDLDWLKKMQADSEITITWINHSFNHHVSPTLPLKENFLLEAGTDINYEVLETEKTMLNNGLTPSVFFRFPGLVSDQQLIYKITGFGLIPIGSDAWLAKGQRAHGGSVVLIHANGNEPVGVEDFLRLLQSKKTEITEGKWWLYDLPQTVVLSQ